LEDGPTYKNRWLILAVMCISLFMISIDNTVLNLALPSISGSLQASTSQLQWVIDAYSLIMASLLITTGSLSDRFGRKRLLAIGLSLFGVGSLGAALSTSIQMLIGFRALLGLAGALIMPSTLSSLIFVFKNGKERATAIAIWSTIFSVGAAIGPIIGGLLLSSFSWSSVFYLNVPIAAVGVTGVLWLLPESFSTKAPKPDFLGVTLSITGMIALVYAMIRAGEQGWLSHEVWIASAIAVVLLTIFIVWQKISANPMLPLVFFKNKSFSGANVALSISSFAMAGSMFFFSQFFQSVQGKSPIMAALYMVPMTPAVLYSTMQSVKVNRRIGTRITMSLGLFITGLGLLFFSLFVSIDMSYYLMVFILLVLGAGIGFTMSPATSSVMNSLPADRAGIGSAMNDTTRQVGGTLGVAVLGSLMNGRYRETVGILANLNQLTAPMLERVRSSIQNALIFAQSLPGDLQQAVVQTSRQAFVNGVRESFLVGSIVMMLSAVAAMLMLPSHQKEIEARQKRENEQIQPAD
jgi:EmrB/QacA subfamily drug resistance transporter